MQWYWYTVHSEHTHTHTQAPAVRELGYFLSGVSVVQRMAPKHTLAIGVEPRDCDVRAVGLEVGPTCPAKLSGCLNICDDLVQPGACSGCAQLHAVVASSEVTSMHAAAAAELH